MRVKQIIALILLFISADLYSLDLNYSISEIKVRGNKTTRESIIIRELLFKTGDSIRLSEIGEEVRMSRENLLNTSLFNYVTITYSLTSSQDIAFEIAVEERWYTWPAVMLKYDDRNFSAWLKAGDLSKSKYGVSLQKFNCFGRRETLILILLFGYENQFLLSYKNIALDKSKKNMIGFEYEVSKQDEVIFATQHNEPVTFRYHYRQVFQKMRYQLNYQYRPRIHGTHNFYITYYDYNAADTIVRLNPDFLTRNRTHLECYTLDYIYTLDNRDSKAYPVKGSFYELIADQTLSSPLSKSSFSSSSVVQSYYEYLPLSNRFYYAFGVNLKLSFNSSHSFLYSRSLGYLYDLHGFEYNTIEGEHFVILKNLIKYNIIKPSIKKINFIPFEKFNKVHYALYFNLFNDLGYVSDRYRTPDNNYVNKLLVSAGAGLDFVTYYDRTLRVEYSINGFGKSGIYLHLTAPLNKE